MTEPRVGIGHGITDKAWYNPAIATMTKSPNTSKDDKMPNKHARALIVLDAQNIYTNPESELFCKKSDKTIDQINRLVDLFAKNREPIVLVRHVHARDGSDLGRMFDFAGPADDFNFKAGSDEVEYDARLHRPNGCHEITKQRYSAFQGTTLSKYLAKNDINHLVVCGFMTNFCCDSTARDAHDRDFYLTFVTDATGCPDLPGLNQDKIRQAVSASMASGFAIVQTTDEYLAARK
jgi:nicotinamidase-related amidase